MKKLIGIGVLTALLASFSLAVAANARQPAQQDEEREAENARLVQRVYAQLVNERDVALIEQYWSEDFVQHNPTLPNGREVLSGFVQSLPPDAYLRIHRVIADGDLVVVHGQLTFTAEDRNNEFAGLALVDIFRVEDGLIAEHWDVSQTVPAESVSGNSMFDGAGQLDE